MHVTRLHFTPTPTCAPSAALTSDAAAAAAAADAGLDAPDRAAAAAAAAARDVASLGDRADGGADPRGTMGSCLRVWGRGGRRAARV